MCQMSSDVCCNSNGLTETSWFIRVFYLSFTVVLVVILHFKMTQCVTHLPCWDNQIFQKVKYWWCRRKKLKPDPAARVSKEQPSWPCMWLTVSPAWRISQTGRGSRSADVPGGPHRYRRKHHVPQEMAATHLETLVPGYTHRHTRTLSTSLTWSQTWLQSSVGHRQVACLLMDEASMKYFQYSSLSLDHQQYLIFICTETCVSISDTCCWAWMAPLKCLFEDSSLISWHRFIGLQRWLRVVCLLQPW